VNSRFIEALIDFKVFKSINGQSSCKEYTSFEKEGVSRVKIFK